MENTIKVDANPTKDFFIYMITRDIETKAAIVELIDNAIDGAKRIRPSGNYSGLNIRIQFDGDSFKIQDNCGGFDIETASKYAFKFGRPNNRNVEKGFFTGLFGIGMKRALFKIGNRFVVKSVTEKESFEIEVDVDTWIHTNDWNFEMKNVVTDGNFPESDRGTTIEISKLNNEQKYNFTNRVFLNNLISYVEKYRSVEAGKGLVISINNSEVSFFKEELIENSNIQCYKNYIKDEDGDIRIVAGISHKGEPENAGWYVFCNGRLILFADKTSVTGWGSNYKSYHPSLAAFRGYVYFESEQLLKLPWNTTKTSVDVTNRLYLIALDLMKEAVEQIGHVVSQIKTNYDVNNLDEIDSVKSAQTVRLDYEYIHGVSKNVDFTIRDMEPKEKYVSISFKEPEGKFAKVKEQLNARSAKAVGEKVFDYYCEMEEL